MTLTDSIKIEISAKVAKALKNMGLVEGKSGDIEKKSRGLFKTMKAGWLLMGTILTGTVALAFKKVTALASDFEEQNAKFLTVFRGVEKEAKAMAETLEASYGVSVIESRKFLSSVQDLFVPLGFAREAASEMSFEVVKLSADLASFNNLPTEQVMRDIQSALVGNFETMKKYGVVINETVLKQAALEAGMKLTNGMVSAQDKAFLALKLITENSKDAIGDFARTSGSLANQTKILTANITNAGVALGQKLAPTVNSIITTLNDWFDVSGDLGTITDKLIATQTEYKDVIDRLKDSAGKLADEERRSLEIREFQLKQKIIEFIKAETAALDEYTGASKKGADARREGIRLLEETERLLRDQIDDLERTGKITVKTDEGFIRVAASKNRLQQNLFFTQRALTEQTAELNEKEEEFNEALNKIAVSINDGITTREQLFELDVRTREEIEKRILSIDDTIEAEKRLAEEKAMIAEAEAIAREEAALDKEAKVLAEKTRQRELLNLRKEMLKEGIADEKTLTRLSKEEMEKRLAAHKFTEELKKDISQTFVDGFLDGVEDMKSGSKSILISMIKQFTSMIAGKLAIKAAEYFAGVATIPLGVLALAGAAAVKVAGSVAAGKIQSAATGADFVTSGPQMLMVGDNPSGQERVQVTPSETNDSHDMNIENLTVQANDPDQLIDQLEERYENNGSRMFPR